MKLLAEVAVLRPDGRLRRLDERGGQVTLPGRLVPLWRLPALSWWPGQTPAQDHRAAVLWNTEHGHTDLGDDAEGDNPVDAGRRLESIVSVVKGHTHPQDRVADEIVVPWLRERWPV